MQLRHFLTPQQPGFHHVGLLDRAELVLTLARQFERDAGDALDFRRGVDLGVDAPALAVGQLLDPARLAEIDAAGQFADDHQVEAANDIGLERRCIDQSVEHRRRTQVGEQAEFLAEPEQAGFRPLIEPDVVPLGSADRAEQDGIDAQRVGHRLVADRHAILVDGGAADQTVLNVERDFTPTIHQVDHAAYLAHNFRANTITGQYQQLLIGGHRVVSPWNIWWGAL